VAAVSVEAWQQRRFAHMVLCVRVCVIECLLDVYMGLWWRYICHEVCIVLVCAHVYEFTIACN